MADRLAKIFGTEEDKVNCPFYFKIGACRHGDTCTRIHNKPPLSQTLALPHLYENPPAAVAFADGLNVPQDALVEAVNHFEDFFEEVFGELAKFGELEEVIVADNIGDHMIGNVYVKFVTEEQAQSAFNGLNGRYYAGRVILAEYSPVTDFRESKCRQYNEGQCDRGGYCNFMHPKHVSKDLKRALFKSMYDEHPEYREHRREQEQLRGNGFIVQFRRKKNDPTGGASKSRSRSPRRGGGGETRGRDDRDRKHRSRRSPSRSDSRRRHRNHKSDRSRSNVAKDEKRRSRSGGRDRDRERRDKDRGDRDRHDRDRHERDRHDRDRHDKDRERDRGDRDRGDRATERDKPRQPKAEDEDIAKKVMRQTSEERRAMFAQWNEEEEKQKNV
eukprot:403348419